MESQILFKTLTLTPWRTNLTFLTIQGDSNSVADPTVTTLAKLDTVRIDTHLQNRPFASLLRTCPSPLQTEQSTIPYPASDKPEPLQEEQVS